MHTLLIGEGPRADHWRNTLTACPQTALAGRVTSTPTKGPVTSFDSIASAFKAVKPEFAVCAGAIAVAQVVEVLETGVPVLVADVEGCSAADLRDVYPVAAADGRHVYLPRDLTYARCTKVLRKFLDSGRLGPIGHISCSDSRAAGKEAGSSTAQLLRHGGGHLEEVCRLLGASAHNVMARSDDENGIAQAYLELDGGLHVHYSGSMSASADTHCLWIEGAKGSLRTDGSSVWWRKRGWRFFVPVFYRRAPAPLSTRRVLERVLARIASSAASAATGADDRMAFGLAVAALLSTVDRRPALLADLRQSRAA